MTDKGVDFKEVDNSDLVFLDGFLLCTIDYDSDFEIETTRKNIRKLFDNLYEKGGMND